MATTVEGDPKASFSVATTPSCKGSSTPFPGFLHFTLDQYLKMQSVKQGSIKDHFFESSEWLNLGLNPGFPGY